MCRYYFVRLCEVLLDIVKESSSLARLGTSDPGVHCEGRDVGWF